jgi:hypothetical protein
MGQTVNSKVWKQYVLGRIYDVCFLSDASIYIIKLAKN